MKRIIFASFLFIGILSINSCQYIQVDTTISPVFEKQAKNRIQTSSDETFSYVDESFLEITKFNTGLPNISPKSAKVQPINYIINLYHTTTSRNSVLKMELRNRDKVDVKNGIYQMAMFALELPNYVGDEDIESIRYARKEYDDLDMSSLNWKKMEVPKLKVVKGLDEFTDAKVLKIEKGIDSDDWLVVEIKFNKPYENTKTLVPYYFKAADKWYQKYMSTGLGAPLQQIQNQNNVE